MSGARMEWRTLVVPAALAGVALVLLLAVVYTGSSWLADQEDAYQRARSELARAAAQYRSASDDTAVYEQYAARFRELEQSGTIGEERRLAWVEALQRVNRELKLPTLRYEISPRERVPLGRLDAASNFLQLHRSTMTLNLGALHEGDVLSLLQTLAAERTGIMEAESCALTRVRGPGALSYDPRVANLEVRCTTHWYTLSLTREGDA